MLNTVKVFFLTVIVIFEIGCSSKFAEPEEVSNFCENVDIGTDFSAVLASLPSQGLVLREQNPKPDHKIIHSFINADSIETALITSEGLQSSNLDPACLIYFSSIFLRGNGKVVYKQYVGETNKGNSL